MQSFFFRSGSAYLYAEVSEEDKHTYHLGLKKIRQSISAKIDLIVFCVDKPGFSRTLEINTVQKS